MRPNFKVRPRAVTHLTLAQGYPWIEMVSYVTITFNTLYIWDGFNDRTSFFFFSGKAKINIYKTKNPKITISCM